MDDEFEHVFRIERHGEILTGTKAELQERIAALDEREALPAERREEHRRQALHDPIDRLVSRLLQLLRRHEEAWERYVEADRTSSLGYLEQATKHLASANEAMLSLLERPRDALRANESFEGLVAAWAESHR